jgi:hypothetical protein
MGAMNVFLNAIIRKEGYRFDDQLHKAFTEKTHYASPQQTPSASQQNTLTFRLYYDLPANSIDPKSKLEAWKEINASMEKALGDLGCANVKGVISFGAAK